MRLGPQNTPYSGCVGRIIGYAAEDLYHVLLDDDPIPRWRNLGILCYHREIRSLENETSKP